MESCLVRESGIYKQEDSYERWSRISLECFWRCRRGQHRTSKHSLSSLTRIHWCPKLLFLHSSCLFYSLRHLYSRRPSGVHHKETLHRPCGACFLPADTKEAITARRGQIGWGSYLGRIMFDILHHYQPPPSPPQESYLSLADVPLSVMNFLCHPPSASPPPAHPTSQPLISCSGAAAEEKQGGERRGNKKKKQEVIDAPCHCKQNGKYNLAFSLCGDNGANTRRQHRLEQTARLVIRQERFGTIWSAG